MITLMRYLAGALLCLAAGLPVVGHAQPIDPALASLNQCLRGPTPTDEAGVMSSLNPALNAADRVAWCLYLYVNSNAATPGNNNALFETWASDGDTFAQTPSWPTTPAASATRLRQPILPHLRQLRQQGGLQPNVLPFDSTQCQPGQLCVGEEVRRNRPTYDYIVTNHLYTRDGLRAFTQKIVLPSDSIEVKANWVPVSQLKQFLTNNAPVDPTLYHVNTVMENGQPVQYALVAMHIISKMVPNWTWATFEQTNNPGRCDILGCSDAFGAATPFVPPISPAQAQGGLYPACTQSAALQALFKATPGLDPAFSNYCLKGSQTDFTDPTGAVVRVGNSVTENGFVETASCMGCHGRAAYSYSTGSWAEMDVMLYNYTPIAPLGVPDPGLFWQQPQFAATSVGQPPQVALFRQADFVWSIPFCAISSDPTVPPPCGGK